ncbi:hypothetical protein [Kitasatospora sp. NPDC002040]|uniref:hypothetical protein n=1 Tax=Kitasatospora sp. NPDC002040 TaxID=3154661 RepID=UPI00331CF576
MAGQQFGAPGPFRAGPKVLLCLAPLVTLGTLGMVPPLLLALRRKRVWDVLGAVVFGLLQLLMYVSLGLTEKGTETGWDLAGGFAVLALMLGAPVHLLVADSRSVWGTPKAAPPAPPAAWYPPPPYLAGAAQPQQAHHPQQAPQPQRSAPTQDDLQQLGELLRRQSQDGGR